MLLGRSAQKSGEPARNSDASRARPQRENSRRTERVDLNFPIRISSIDDGAQDFSSEGYTLDISAHGATIVVDRELQPPQAIKVQRVGSNKEATARVVIRGPAKRDEHLFGIAFNGDATGFWDIEFPTDVQLDKTVVRALLRCAVCGSLQLVYLDDFESDRFLCHHSLARLCSQCSGWTVWTRPFAHLHIDLAHRSGADGHRSRSPYFIAAGSQNRRSYQRLQAETVGCVRHPGIGTEVVVVRDLGPGGLSFYSTTDYVEGTHLEMAVPYSSKAPNVFIPVRIVGLQKGEDKTLIQYSACFVT